MTTPKQPKKIDPKAGTEPYVCNECGAKLDLKPGDPRVCPKCGERVYLVG
jgi:DNA-directed RNA polymerase subunit RPC12/RpoP